MLIDFRGGIRVYPQTCPRSLVFRVEQPKGEADMFCAGVRKVDAQELTKVALDYWRYVIDDRNSAIETMEIKMGPILSKILPKVGAEDLVFRISTTPVKLIVGPHYDVRIRRDVPSGGLILRFDTFTVLSQDFSAQASVRTPIEVGTFETDDRPPQTAWERMVADD